MTGFLSQASSSNSTKSGLAYMIVLSSLLRLIEAVGLLESVRIRDDRLKFPFFAFCNFFRFRHHSASCFTMYTQANKVILFAELRAVYFDVVPLFCSIIGNSS